MVMSHPDDACCLLGLMASPRRHCKAGNDADGLGPDQFILTAHITAGWRGCGKYGWNSTENLFCCSPLLLTSARSVPVVGTSQAVSLIIAQIDNSRSHQLCPSNPGGRESPTVCVNGRSHGTQGMWVSVGATRWRGGASSTDGAPQKRRIVPALYLTYCTAGKYNMFVILQHGTFNQFKDKQK